MPPLVHQETDGAAVHAEHRLHAFALQHGVQRLQHEAIAAERDQGLRVVGVGEAIVPLELLRRGLGDVGGRGEQADAAAGEVDRGAGIGA